MTTLTFKPAKTKYDLSCFGIGDQERTKENNVVKLISSAFVLTETCREKVQLRN